MEPNPVDMVSSNALPWVSEGLTLLAVAAALVAPYLVYKLDGIRERARQREKRHIALKVIYPEMNQLTHYFMSLGLDMDLHNPASLMKYANETNDVDPKIPKDPINDRLELTGWLGTTHAGQYVVALNRRAEVIRMMNLYLSKNWTHDEDGNPVTPIDDNTTRVNRIHIEQLSEEGLQAAAKLAKSAEEVDKEISYRGIRIESLKLQPSDQVREASSQA